MPITQQENRNEVKKIKFHHKVKRFYYKNLFRKIYTVAIIGLIGANIFSMVKYASFADESYNMDILSTNLNITLSEEKILPLNGNGGESFTFRDMEVTDGTTTFTIMDRNLGATSNDITSEDSYGYYYQWGNNYGFPRDTSVISLLLSPVNASNNGPDNYYESSTWIENYPTWDSSDNKNLWGGEGDDRWIRGEGTDADRQGPCPSGYHVPSSVERQTIEDVWCNASPDYCNYDANYGWSVNGINFSQIFKLPIAGDIGYSTYYGKWNVEGSRGKYWSSSYYSQYSKFQHEIYDRNVSSYWEGSYKGLSVRCIKNVPTQPQTFTVIFDDNGIEGHNNPESVQGTIGWYNAYVSLPWNGNDEYTFLGWSTSLSGGEIINSDTRGTYQLNQAGTITLYAQWEKKKEVTYDYNGGDCGDDNCEDYVQYIDKGNFARNPGEPYKGGSIFMGWFTSDGYRWNFNEDVVEEDMTLYARYQEILKDGYIELSYGGETVYIKDRNQGGENVLEYDKNVQEIEELAFQMCTVTEEFMCREDLSVSDGCYVMVPNYNECSAEFYTRVSEIAGINLNNGDKVADYVDVYDGDKYTYGDYYFRGNNVGATYDELGTDNWPIQISQNAINRGFNGGKLGELEGDGWIEGNEQNNPCNAEEGEYLPTVSDWAKAMRIWSNIKGYDYYEDGGYVAVYNNGNGRVGEFLDNILVPNAGYIYDNYYAPQQELSVNGLTVSSNYDLLNHDIYYDNRGGYLWTSLDSGNNVGHFNGNFYYWNIGGWSDDRYDQFNTEAAPVRCFIDPDEVNGVEKYEVTFDTKGGIETIASQIIKEGKKVKEPSTPTKNGYTFAGWYTSDGTKWNFDTDTVKGTMTLYAKWKVCGEGYNVVGNKCIPDNIEGIITVTDGKDTKYIRDRNVGVSDAAVRMQKFYNAGYEDWNSWEEECNDADDYSACWNEKWVDAVNDMFETEYSDVYEIYSEMLEDLLGGILDEEEMEYAKFQIYVNMQCGGGYDCMRDNMPDYMNEFFDVDLEDMDDVFDYLYENYPEHKDNIDGFHWSLEGSNDSDESCIEQASSNGNTDWDMYNQCILEYINDTYGTTFNDVNKAYNYIGNFYWGYWNYFLDRQADGNYYYRGNNSGVSYNDLEFNDENDDRRITNMSGLKLIGFNEGNMGKPAGNGWIEGEEQNNPCDASKGEYLPTVDDWKNLMTIWGNANKYVLESVYSDGEDLSAHRLDTDGYGYNKFRYDLLIPYGGEIYDEMCRNQDTQQNDIPCTRFDDEIPGMWTAQDEEGNVGFLYDPDPRAVEFTNYNNYKDNWGGNTYAVPVRCFVNLPEVLSITFNTNGGSEVSDMNVIKGDTVSLPTPTKTNYTFAGWYTDKSFTQQFTSSTPVTEDITLYAKWTESSTPTNNGGSSSRPHKTDKDETHASAEETQTDNTKEDTKTDDQQGKTMAGLIKSEITVKDTVVSNNATYTPEQNQAYQFAKSNGITTTSSIKEAKMNTPLTRIQMAKMLSQYAMNVLGKTPDHSAGVVNFRDVTNKMNKDYDNGVTLAYQLGIMGINMPNNEFRPNDTVTRAEFATALSRMIYGIEDGKGKVKYYEPHIARLYNDGIITNTNPNMKELRGYVMTMLMRTVK